MMIVLRIRIDKQEMGTGILGQQMANMGIFHTGEPPQYGRQHKRPSRRESSRGIDFHGCDCLRGMTLLHPQIPSPIPQLLHPHSYPSALKS